MNTEPVAIAGGSTTLVSTVLAMLQGFSVIHFTEVQMGLVLGVWGALVAVVLLFVRSKVTPVAKLVVPPAPPAP